MKRILAAIDHSAPALRAAELAADIAIRFASELVLMTVSRPIDHRDPALLGYLREEHIHDPIGVVIADAARAELRPLGDRLAERLKRSVACEVLTGNPAEMIVAFATRSAIDLIAIGHVGHGRLGTLVLGSVARPVIDTASCPVLVVH
jgi:nucleotide-binding universal stress UspA family protein